MKHLCVHSRIAASSISLNSSQQALQGTDNNAFQTGIGPRICWNQGSWCVNVPQSLMTEICDADMCFAGIHDTAQRMTCAHLPATHLGYAELYGWNTTRRHDTIAPNHGSPDKAPFCHHRVHSQETPQRPHKPLPQAPHERLPRTLPIALRSPPQSHSQCDRRAESRCGTIETPSPARQNTRRQTKESRAE